jgi:uncharacterized membrane protein YphA (DoxX/SURF4 family)
VLADSNSKSQFSIWHEKFQPWITLLVRIGLGSVLIIAGGLKAVNPQKSAMAVRAYEVLPIPVANFFGFVLPWSEIAIGLILMLGAFVRVAGLLSAAVMLLFILAISQAGLRGLSIDCGCFGGGGKVAQGETKYLAEIFRDIGFMLMGLYAYRFPRGKFGIDKN